jgi:hypothetical protein
MKKTKNKVINLFGNYKVAQNTGVKYSELLEQFMSPFYDDFRDAEYIEDSIDFAINAWNFGNLKVLLPKEQFNETANLIQEVDIDALLLSKMIDFKVTNFKEHTNFIVDFELTETNADPILKVITQTQDDYFTNMMDSLDNEVTQDDFEENYINRIAIVLKPLQPFIDWQNTIYPDSPIDHSDIKEPNIYLINDDIDDLEAWLRKKFDKFFMMELEDWHINKKEWPQKRNFKMFKLWFQVEVSTMIYDLEKRPVLKIE